MFDLVLAGFDLVLGLTIWSRTHDVGHHHSELRNGGAQAVKIWTRSRGRTKVKHLFFNIAWERPQFQDSILILYSPGRQELARIRENLNICLTVVFIIAVAIIVTSMKIVFYDRCLPCWVTFFGHNPRINLSRIHISLWSFYSWKSFQWFCWISFNRFNRIFVQNGCFDEICRKVFQH